MTGDPAPPLLAPDSLMPVISLACQPGAARKRQCVPPPRTLS